jgi:molybdopterin/thiamine biosynthesis adenylyltransferase
MKLTFSKSPQSIRLSGKRIPGAEDRHRGIPGWDHDKYSKAHVLCIGAGGLISNVAPTLCRKGIGGITLLDDDIVEPSNLNRQRFYTKDVGKNKAIALARNLQPECIGATEIRGYPLLLEEAISSPYVACDIVICGVDNNPGRLLASSFFRPRQVPVIFTAVSRDADHGYIFVQDSDGPCIACLFPDMVNDDRFPCPGTPAIADILQAVGAFAVYAVDTLLMKRPRAWNYRRLSVSGPGLDGGSIVAQREGCELCRRGVK